MSAFRKLAPFILLLSMFASRAIAEDLAIDGNNRPVVGAVTDDANLDVRNLRVDPTTNGLIVAGTISASSNLRSENTDGAVARTYWVQIGGKDGSTFRPVAVDASGALAVQGASATQGTTPWVVGDGGNSLTVDMLSEFTVGSAIAPTKGINLVGWDDTNSQMRYVTVKTNAGNRGLGIFSVDTLVVKGTQGFSGNALEVIPGQSSSYDTGKIYEEPVSIPAGRNTFQVQVGTGIKDWCILKTSEEVLVRLHAVSNKQIYLEAGETLNTEGLINLSYVYVNTATRNKATSFTVKVCVP